MNIKFENLEKIDDVLALLHSLKNDQSIEKRWLTVNELSNYIGYSKDRIYDLSRVEFIEGKHFFKKGKLLFDKNEIDNWVMNGAHKSNFDSKQIVDNVLKDIL